MREFFRGWKRKLGCVTLVLACVFAAGWVRSLFVQDLIVWQSARVACDLYSHTEGVSIRFSQEKKPSFDPAMMGLDQLKVTSVRNGARLHIHPIGLQRDILKMAYLQRLEITVAYWSIVVPLTLLSAWLLLSMPRAKKTTEPKPDPLR